MSDAWDVLADPWRECLRLAWQSFVAGSVPVGAVLVDGTGATVSTGRNLKNEKPDAEGHVAGSNLAHAEVNALATLPVGVYADHVLYTSLEPCLLCTAALRLSHIGTVRFAAPDPVWYAMDRIAELNHHVARRWTRREGPLGGPFQAWSAALPLTSAVERDITSVVDTHGVEMPGVLRVAERMVAAPLNRLRTLELPDALAEFWDELVAC